MSTGSFHGSQSPNIFSGEFNGVQTASTGLKYSSPFAANVVPTWTTNPASLMPDYTVASAPLTWTLTDDTISKCTAIVTYNLVFSSPYAGNKYYGVIFQGVSGSGFPTLYAILFDAFYQVPPGGGTLVVTAEIDMQNC